ncbi:antitoxin [Enterocloster clostridioformis]|uniref:antitoxin n=1 Tax=Enterocloster clostridioformis TaxID=1531 RepID=UPI001F32A92E|nr:hypothetical protein [Enterocloster clostridioformis]
MPLKLYRLKAVVFTLGLENKIGDVVLLMPKGDKWSGFLSALNLFSDDFMEEGRGETAGQEREEL